METLRIAKRGNFCGAKPSRENTIDYLKEAINRGYCIECDIWYDSKNDKFYLGHDKPEHVVYIEFLRDERIFVHAKDLITYSKLIKYKDVQCFYEYINYGYSIINDMIWFHKNQANISNINEKSILHIDDWNKLNKPTIYGIYGDSFE